MQELLKWTARWYFDRLCECLHYVYECAPAQFERNAFSSTLIVRGLLDELLTHEDVVFARLQAEDEDEGAFELGLGQEAARLLLRVLVEDLTQVRLDSSLRLLLLLILLLEHGVLRSVRHAHNFGLMPKCINKLIDLLKLASLMQLIRTLLS